MITLLSSLACLAVGFVLGLTTAKVMSLKDNPPIVEVESMSEAYRIPRRSWFLLFFGTVAISSLFAALYAQHLDSQAQDENNRNNLKRLECFEQYAENNADTFEGLLETLDNRAAANKEKSLAQDQAFEQFLPLITQDGTLPTSEEIAQLEATLAKYLAASAEQKSTQDAYPYPEPPTREVC